MRVGSGGGIWIAAIGLALLAACHPTPRNRCAEQPSFEQTAHALETCLSAEVSTADIEHTLLAWERIGPEWGGVSQADLLAGGGPEVITRYHADLQSAMWNPHGKLIALQRDGRQWRVAFDASSLKIRTRTGAVWDNWRYDILDVADATGDGLDELLVDLLYSNGLHAVLRYHAVLTAHPREGRSELRAAFLEETTTTRPAFAFVDRNGQTALQRVVSNLQDHELITRTYGFNADAFELAEEEINPGFSTAAATTPDGSQWVAFDEFDGVGGSSLYSPQLGLYRIKDDQLAHFDVPATLRVLKTGPDGSLYVGAGCGVLRYRMDQWETLANIDCGQSNFKGVVSPFDIAFAHNGDLWVGGIFGLARYDGADWTEYAVMARRLWVAPDDSLWTAAWDGRADSNCCYTRVTGDTWVTFTYSATLPVSADWLEQIGALARR